MPHIAFTGGLVDIVFGDGYFLVDDSWTPRIARRSTGPFAGSSHMDVLEEMAIIIVEKENSPEAFTKLDDLIAVFDEAALWFSDPGAPRITMEVSLDGSSLSDVLTSLVYVHPEDGDAIELSGDYEMSDHYGGVIRRVFLRFRRRDKWLYTTETKSAGPSTGNPALFTIGPFTDNAPIPWPFDAQLQIEVNSPYGLEDGQNIYMFFQNALDKLYLKEAESFTNGSGASNAADTTASAGNVKNLDGSAGGLARRSMSDSSPGISSSARLVQVYAQIKAGANPWNVTCRLTFEGGPADTVEGRTVRLSTVNDGLVDLGIFATPGQITRIDIGGYPAAGTTDIDIDYVIAIVLDDAARILTFLPVGLAQNSNTLDVFVAHRRDTNRRPIIYSRANVTGTHMGFPSYRGTTLLESKGTTLYCLVSYGGPSNPVSSNNWVIMDATDPTPLEVDLSITVTRMRAFLAPI